MIRFLFFVLSSDIVLDSLFVLSVRYVSYVGEDDLRIDLELFWWL